MNRKSVLLAALVALTPTALLAAGPIAPAPVHGPRGDGEWFSRLDTNHDGAITQDEANAASAERIAKSFARLDADHDGMVTQDEMRAAAEARREETTAAAAARFKAADKNGDGFISKEEAAAGMPMLARNFDALDTNKDGQVSPEELAAARHRMGGGHWKGRPGEPTQR